MNPRYEMWLKTSPKNRTGAAFRSWLEQRFRAFRVLQGIPLRQKLTKADSAAFDSWLASMHP